LVSHTIKETEVEREKTAGLQNPLGASSDNVKFAGGSGDIVYDKNAELGHKWTYTPSSQATINKRQDIHQEVI